MSLFNVQWELSNPQYFPDDSAPPVPNMTVSSLEESSIPFHQTGDYYALQDAETGYGGQLDLGNFAGIQNSAEFDYSNGLLQTTVDHLFYSYLNVESIIPAFRINSQRSFDMYFRELIPASCGLYTIDIPDTGKHVLYTYSLDGNANKLAYSSFGEMYSPDFKTTTSSRTSLVNHSDETVMDFRVLDFLIDFNSIPLSSTSQVTIEGVNYSLDFVVSRYDIVFTLHRDYADGETYQATHSFTEIDLDNTIYCRLNFNTKSFTSQYTNQDNNIVETTSDFADTLPSRLGTKVNRVVMPSSSNGTSLAMQVIGYDFDEVGSLDFYDSVVRPKSHYYDVMRYNYGMDMFLPTYSGNMWDYVNKLSTTQGFVELL